MAAAAGGDTLLSMANDDDDVYPSTSSSSTSTSMMTDDEITVQYTMNHIIVQYGYPLLRLSIALLMVYLASGVSSKRRLYSGFMFSGVAAFVTYTFLEPLFVPVRSEIAMVFMYILVFDSAMVGMALGVLLPLIFPGVCLGALVGLLGVVMSGTWNAYLFPITGAVLAVILAIVSSRLSSSVILTFATALEVGVLASCIVMKSMLPFLMDVARGFPYYQSIGNDTTEYSTRQSLLLGSIWIASTLLVGAVIVYRDGNFGSINLVGMLRSGYAPIPQSAADEANRRPNSALAPLHQAPPIRNDSYNMFDPADLPPRLAEYANMVFSACEDLGNFFGFQDSSVRNQAEHLLILLSNNRRYMSSHILPPSVQPPSPIHALHAKVFSNYVKWCRAMGVPPHFSKMSKMNISMNAPPAVASRVVDLVLYFCIWGESANLRHMPECVWCLYHKMMEEYIQSEGYTQARSLYAGHFLDTVVTPIFQIICRSLQSKVDHQDKRNYDDFNEFFWSRNCLLYHYSSVNTRENGEADGGAVARLPGELLPSLVDGLASAPKTFLEKRSWLRGILALSRIVEWHIVTFYVLGVIAFSRELVWGWVYSLQAASAVFWAFNSLHLLWALLEVWASFPGIQLSGTDVCGSVFVLVARYVTLVYQTLYLMWAFSPQKGVYLGVEADSTFWWWQYIWLSLLVMIPYFLEAILQIVPEWATRLYNSQNDFVQSFLNILYPLSRLYVAKDVHESFSHTVVYMLFWITLLTWKLFFSYVFEVYSMVLPTLELTDDYLNYPNQSFAKMVILLSMRWLPQFIVYIIDMSIWYAAWQAFAGTAVGLSDHLGNIRSMDDIRMNFGQVPEHFCRKLLSPDAGSRRGSSASFLGSSTNSLSEGTSLLGTDPHKLQSYVNRLLDVRIQKWVMFSAAWNEIIDHFRNEDIISNTESDNLRFSQFDGFSQAIYLPVFQTAGAIEDVLAEVERPADEYKDPRTGHYTDTTFFKPISDHITMQTAVAEVWELGSFIFLQILGPVHSTDVHAIVNTVSNWAENGTMTAHLKVENMRSVMQHFKDAISILQIGIGKRKSLSRPKPTQKRAIESKPPQSLTGLRRAVSAGSLSSFEIDSTPRGHAAQRDVALPSMDVGMIDALRDQVRDKLRNVTHALKSMLKSAGADMVGRDVLDRLTFLGSKENGFFWDDSYASSQLDEVCKNATFKAVLKKMYGLVCMHPDDTEPKSKEARRRLTFFVNTLFMDMPDAPSIHDMFSWNVLTPFYSEDVIYSKGDLEKRSDALGVSTLLYLQTLYRADWNNFLERLGITDEDKIFSSKFINETRRWASIRSQTLSRTVHGIMYCEKALRLLANLERLDDDVTNDLLGEKFGYVVSCQVYGTMKRNQDPKADDIESLMHRYPLLRVAYIDSVRLNRSGESVYYSCLVKSDRKGGVQEIYRVRLPDNPIIGEGKPENQNHAMIFTRGEFLQTIDMNQEGYFEEALKMRNCLQEFAKREGPLPTTILGLREHIFTGSVSSLANYMASQEHSFVTLGQRVLARPLRIRLHYGHPDVFDKLFFITRGGVSKASKGINLSEDIFAGYNNVLRGGSVGFKEYVQFGKGRDVGMSQIYQFEAKLSQGAAEQSLSRDVYRMCNRLDFFRLLSYYYGGIGHYFSNVLTIFTVYVVVYLMTLLAIFNLEKIGDRTITPMGTIQMLLGGLGLLQTIPLFATLGVERGWLASIQEIFRVFITGGPLHFMFHIQTKANYMSQTILVGGAKYRPTGRGFVTQHTPFDEQYRNFASSHLYLGVELAAGLILMGVYTHAGQYFGRTWSLWLASASFLCSPFWFNPLTFDWSVVINDYDLWLKWIRGSSGGATKSWSMWYNEENSLYKGLPVTSKLVYLIKVVLNLLIAEGIRKSDLFKSDVTLNTPTIGIGTIISFLAALLVLGRLFSAREKTVPYPVRRTIGIMLFTGIVLGVAMLFIEDQNYIRYAIAGYYGVGALCLIGLLMGVKFVKQFYLIHDIVCGHLIFIPLFVLAALQLPGLIQTWLLYQNALSTDVVVSDILRYARKSQESGSGESNEELIEQVNDLRRLVQKQEQILVSAGFTTGKMGLSSSGSVADLIMSPTPEPPVRSASGNQPVSRALSMSGIDVWGNMALGDVQAEELKLTQLSSGVAIDGAQGISAASQFSQGFSFTQPDTMPPR